MTDSTTNPLALSREHSRMPEDFAGLGESTDLEQTLSAMVTTDDLRHVRLWDLLTKPSLLLLVDRQQATGHRSLAGIFWVEERLASDIRLVVVWPIPPQASPTGFPARKSTLELLDHTGELGRLLAPRGKEVCWLVKPDSGTLVRVTSSDQAFATSRDWRKPNRQEADRAIDLGDLTI